MLVNSVVYLVSQTIGLVMSLSCYNAQKDINSFLEMACYHGNGFRQKKTEGKLV